MNTPDTEWESVLKEFDDLYPPVTIGYDGNETDFFRREKMREFIIQVISSRDTYWKERVRKEVEDMSHNIKIEIAGISGILNGSAVSDSGQAHTAQMKLGNILEALDTLLDNMK